MKNFEFIVGRLLCRPVRDFLKRCQFNNLDIEFYESSGLLDRTFVIKGNDKDVTNVKHSLFEWAKDLDE